MPGSMPPGRAWGNTSAAFGVGPLKDASISLSAIFGFTAFIAAAMAVLSFFIRGRATWAKRTASGSGTPTRCDQTFSDLMPVAAGNGTGLAGLKAGNA